ncbi:hypothetical protein [Cryptosporangium sp. NPDC048952]|uniref:hypothetical protein n=1 Tax=Cryptosporangium sp. NPDC048952 TaxID=3363961 RepID=UPI003723C673
MARLQWSVIDHDLVPKAAYHYLRRAFAPVLASFRSDGDTLELWVSNSGRDPVAGSATVSLAGFDGTVVVQASVDVKLQPGESNPVWTLSDVPLSADRYAWVESALFPSNRLYFAEIKDLPVSGGSLDVAARSAPGLTPHG